jgi:hypothetical protein
MAVKRTGSYESRYGHARTRTCSHPQKKARQEGALERLLNTKDKGERILKEIAILQKALGK